MSIRDTS